MIGCDRLVLRGFRHGESGKPGEQFGKHAGTARIEVHHHHEGDAGLGRHGREELLQGGHSSRGGAEAHDGR